MSNETGTPRKLTDDLGVTGAEPGSHERSDEQIREDVCERLGREPHVDVGEVSVEVRDAVVFLEGSVPDRQMKHAIEDISASCRCVKDVDNRIRVERTGAQPPHPGIF